MELGGIQTFRSGLPSLEVLERLPYLTAINQEGLRLSYGVAPRMPRIAPDLTLECRGSQIPPGTPVSMTHSLIFHDEDILPDSYTFSPERFMDSDQKKRIEEIFAPLQQGASCLGKQ